MKYSRFEDLPVWKAASALFGSIDSLCDDQSLRRRGDLANQLHRATLSISNNIAEGFELGTTQQLISHLYIARGSAGEVRNMLIQIDELPRLCHLKSQISNLKSQSEAISRQLRAWADALQNSSVQGQRYLTDELRDQEERRVRRAAFEATLANAVARSRMSQPSQSLMAPVNQTHHQDRAETP